MDTFKVVIKFTDTSYQDESDRTDYVVKNFSSLEEVNEFLKDACSKPYSFPGRDAIVLDVVEPEHVSVTETINIDWRTLPCFKNHAELLLKKELLSIAKYGGDLKALENKTKSILNWERSYFLEMWHNAIKEAVSQNY